MRSIELEIDLGLIKKENSFLLEKQNSKKGDNIFLGI